MFFSHYFKNQTIDGLACLHGVTFTLHEITRRRNGRNGKVHEQHERKELELVKYCIKECCIVFASFVPAVPKQP